MVGPSLSKADRAVASRRLKLGFVVLVGGSGGLVAVSTGATPVQALIAVVVGLLVGWALMAYLGRVGRQWRAKRRR
jgi:purine-cytosine permease-like protein